MYGTNTVCPVCEKAKQFLEIWTNFKGTLDFQILRCVKFSHHFKKISFYYHTNMQNM